MKPGEGGHKGERMHEFGIAEELVAEVDRSVAGHAGRRAGRVVVAVGAGAAEEQSLRAAFEVAKVGTTASDAELVLEFTEREVLCLDCGAQTSLQPPAGAGFSCPSCGSQSGLQTRAPEVVLKSVEVQL